MATPTSTDCLRSASVNFLFGYKPEGFKEFSKADTSQQNRVYEQLWINKDRPTGNPEFGNHSFHDRYGYSSTLQEKAQAIDDQVSMDDMRMQAHGYSSTRIEYTSQGRPYVVDRWIELYVPQPRITSNTEAVGAGIGLTLFVVLGAIHECFSSFKK